MWIVDGRFLIRTNGAFADAGMVWINKHNAKKQSVEASVTGTYVSNRGEKIAFAQDGTATIQVPEPHVPEFSAAYLVQGNNLVLYVSAKPPQTVNFKIGNGQLTTTKNENNLGRVWKKQ
jgi:hypothetical protein